jgi:hypothetical protein
MIHELLSILSGVPDPGESTAMIHGPRQIAPG